MKKIVVSVNVMIAVFAMTQVNSSAIAMQQPVPIPQTDDKLSTTGDAFINEMLSSISPQNGVTVMEYFEFVDTLKKIAGVAKNRVEEIDFYYEDKMLDEDLLDEGVDTKVKDDTAKEKIYSKARPLYQEIWIQAQNIICQATEDANTDIAKKNIEEKLKAYAPRSAKEKRVLDISKYTSKIANLASLCSEIPG